MTDSEPGGDATRGTLEVRERVVTRIAEIAAGRVSGVERVAGGLTARTLPHVEASVRSGRVTATVEAATRWPTPIADVASRIRTAVSEDLVRASGLDVDAVDVRIHYVAPERNSTTTRRVE
ncbi:MAG: Asp23/Gls24 family envelope stress response protein [Rhodococcus sp. (in: high G+C Gram-positive bacteria)]